MRKLSFPCLVAFLVMLGMSAPAQAIFVPIGDVMGGSSWGQLFNETGVGNFDYMRVDWISNDKFEPPAFRGFSSGTWTVWGSDVVSSAHASVDQVNVNFNLWFNGHPDTGRTAFYFAAFDNGVIKERAYADHGISTPNQPGGWFIRAATANEYNPTALPEVPEPGTLLTFGLCLAIGSLAEFKRRRK